MMARDDGHIIVDVRRQDEYDAGHIPGAILIPNESIVAERPAELPDPDQIILIYCRSGNRSKQAAQKLADMGYTNIYEFGGNYRLDGRDADHRRGDCHEAENWRNRGPCDLGGERSVEALRDPSVDDSDVHVRRF